MSSFEIQAKHKETGEVHAFLALDGYFGGRNYGYAPMQDQGARVLAAEEFYRIYEEIA